MIAAVVMLTGMALPATALDETVVDVTTASRADVIRLADLGLDLAEEANVGATTVVADAEDLKLIEANGFRWKPNRLMARPLRERFAGRAAADAGLYHTYAETVAGLEAARPARQSSRSGRAEKRDVPPSGSRSGGLIECPRVQRPSSRATEGQRITRLSIPASSTSCRS
jgi:hypothetical protein